MIAEAKRIRETNGRDPLVDQQVWGVGRTAMHTQHFEDAQTGLSDRLSAAVGRYPIAAIATAAAIGIAAGWWVKRS